jgi:hypothetical protein
MPADVWACHVVVVARCDEPAGDVAPVQVGEDRFRGHEVLDVFIACVGVVVGHHLVQQDVAPQTPLIEIGGGLVGLGGVVRHPAAQEPSGAFHGRLSLFSHCSIGVVYWSRASRR